LPISHNTHGSSIILSAEVALETTGGNTQIALDAAWLQDRDGGQEKPLAWGQHSWSLGGRQVHQARRVEQLHEPLVGAPRLRRREVEVLVENRGQAPLLQLPQSPDNAASPVLKEKTHHRQEAADNC